MVRKFEYVHNERGQLANLPKRSTEQSAGYDLALPDDMEIVIPAHGIVTVGLGIKVRMEPDEAFLIANRSSSPKKGYVCPLGIGVIDADYYNNPDNEGELFMILMSIDGEEQYLEGGTRVAQGLFVKYGVTDDDTATGKRTGGIGSTDGGKK